MSEDTFEIKPATRQAAKPLIGLYSESGCGKTYSALLLARGIVGKDGKIVLVDSESRRGSLYADVIEGGYDTLDLCSPFSPKRYIEAVEAVERSGADIGIIDSASHEWEGIGGVLDMAAQNEERSGKPGLHIWKLPKMEHAKMMLRLLQSSIPWIVCLRAKYKSRQVKNNGKTEIVKDEATSPIQADDFIFEMTAHAEILRDHTIILTKCSHPALKDCFPEDQKEPLSIKHGELIAKWASEGATSRPQKPTKAAPAAEAIKAKAEIWKLAKVHFNDDIQDFKQYLWDEGILSDTESLEELPIDRLNNVLANIKAKYGSGELL